MEIIVPFDSTVRGIRELEGEFPQVKFVDMGNVGNAGPGERIASHSLLDLRTTVGLTRAQGDIVALLEDYGVPDPDWCHQLVQAHRLLPYSVIGGAVEHSGIGLTNWAVYLLDFGRYGLPLREGPSDYLTDVNVSYKKSALESVRETWSKRYNEVQVHSALVAKGVVLWQRPDVVVREDRGTLPFRAAAAERLAWGRVYGYMRTRQISPLRRILYIVAAPAIVCVVIARVARKGFTTARNRMWFLRSLPFVIVLAIFWCLGEVTGYWTGAESFTRNMEGYVERKAQ